MQAITRILLGSTALTQLGRIGAGIALLSSSPALALPQNGSVVGGSASITQTSSTQLDITQTSNRAVIDWQSFSIGANETTNFHQPSASAIAVNRVTGVDPSQIMGKLNANGQVVLINPNGILFSKGAQVNVGGLVASTTGITTQNAMNGSMVFDQPGKAGATVENQGSITAAQGGLVALVAPNAINSGVITATLGKVSLAAGDQWTMDLYGDHLVNFAVNDQLAAAAGVTNSGTISGSTVELSANVAKGIVSNAINMSGVIEATRVSSQGGTVILAAGDSGVAITGSIDASGASGGTISVSGDSIIHQGVLDADGFAGPGGQVTLNTGSVYIDTANASTSAKGSRGGGGIAVSAGTSLYSSGSQTVTSSGGVGGTVTMTAPATSLVGATIDASGALGGGSISIGGGAEGGGTPAPAATTNVTGSASLTANATTNGNGGIITIWSDDQTNFAGSTSARGGAVSGNGGTIEVSSAGNDRYAGVSDASATNGTSGQLRLDPKTIIVDSTAALFPQFQFLNPNPTLTGTFGSVTLSLSSGNVAISDPTATIGLGPASAGAAYLFNGLTGQLISALTGSVAGDKVGTNLTALTNGNFVVSETTWNGGMGAASLVSGTLGLSGAVSSANSLIGSSIGDNVGLTVTALTNGNYVVGSSNWSGAKGAATWGSGSLGVTGTITSSNSLIGSSAGDQVGLDVTALSNGDYVVGSPDWNSNKGAASWGNGSTGLTGTVTASNSLIGSTGGDEIGLTVTALTNGDYVVGSPDWNSSKGAASWGNGSLGLTGTVTASNSLIGSLAGDEVGLNVTALSNGNYVVGSPDWALTEGAASWGNGSTGLTGTVTSSNSLIGGTVGDKVGLNITALLTNGNYVVQSPNWTGNKGAASWGNGATGITGTISTSNSLIGSTSGDEVGLNVTALTNGNYVVGSPDWALSKGAATWGSGSVGVKGTITSGNSLIGSSAGDQVGLGVTALANGNYVVQSPLWDGTLGAASFASGTLGLDGTISSSNSLIGSTIADKVGLHVTALTNGNYVVGSPLWDLTLGAATWGSGTLGIDGAVSSANSLTGSLVGDLVGSSVVALNAGGYVVGSFGWNGGLGAATYGIGNAALTGTISSLNSIIGTSALLTPIVTIKSIAATGNFTVSFGSAASGSEYEGFTNPNQLTYSAAAGDTVTIAPSFITQVLNTGTAVTLQANDDITINSAITANAGGNGGTLTLQAGRSILLNNSITTDNGSLTLVANDTAADSVVNSQRDTGAGVIAMAMGTSLNAGTGTVSITSKTGAGVTNASAGNITLNTVTGSTISVIDQNQKTLTLNGALTASAGGDSIVISTGILANNDGAGVLNPGLGRYVLYTIDPTVDSLDGLSGFTEHYGISYALAPPSNYTSGGDYSLYSITPTVTITNSNASKIYGSANPTLSFTDTGLINGDTLGAALVAAPTLTTSATTSSGVGSYSITLANTLSSSLGYNIVVNNGTLSVTPAALTITANNASKIYGAANPPLSASYAGFVNGDSAAVVSGLSVTTTATVGSGVGTYAITASGASAANYSINYGPSGSLTVGQAPLTITANNASRLYGATNPAFTATYSGLVNGDGSGVVTNLMFSTSATTASNVGSYAITASNAIAANYAISYVNGTLSVTQAPVTITAGSASRLYGAVNPTLSASYSGLVNGDSSSVITGLSLSTTATSSSNVGAYAVTGSGATASNYSLSYVSGVLSVTPAALTITANNSSRLYGTANPSFSATYSGLVNGDTTGAITGLSLTTTATTASNVGSYAITAAGGMDGNYTISYGAAGVLTVGQAALTITAHNASRLYGASNPSFSATYSGLVNGDGSGVVTNLLLGTSATTASNVGSYAITGTNATATNYAITYVNGTLAVTPAPLTIDAGNSSRLYGAANPTFSASYSGLVNGDMSSVVSGLSLTTSATSASNVGAYAITGSGATAANYTIAYGPSGTLSVTPAALTITANNSSRVYGANNPTFSASYNGLVNGDTSGAITGLSLTTTATTASNVGTYAIAAGGGTANNYVITYGPSGMLSITPAALTITPDNTSRVYGAANPAFSATYSGLVNGDTSAAIIGYSLATAATTASNVGSYAITGSGGSAANYTITYGPSGMLSITPAALTITTSSSSRLYGAANPNFSASYSGLVNGDNSTVVSGLSYSTTATTASNVGSYAISASGGSAANYAIAYGPSGMLTITPAALTITPNNSTRTYGSNNMFTASFSGLTAGDTSSAIGGLSLSSPATISSNVGTYAITAAGAIDPNYTISYGPSGILTVTPAPLTIAPNSSTQLVGTTPILAATVTGLVAGDTISSIAGLMLSSPATRSSSPGTYSVSASGATASNYIITYGPNGTLTLVTMLPIQPTAPLPPAAPPTSAIVSPTIMEQIVLTNGPIATAQINDTSPATTRPIIFSQVALNQATVLVGAASVTDPAPYNAPVVVEDNPQDDRTLCLKVGLDSTGSKVGQTDGDSCSAPLNLHGF